MAWLNQKRGVGALLALLLLLPTLVWAQTVPVAGSMDVGGTMTVDTLVIPSGTTPPDPCVLNSFFRDTDATAGAQLLLCVQASPADWVVQGGGSGSGDVESVAITTTAPLSGGTTCNSGACTFTLGSGTITASDQLMVSDSTSAVTWRTLTDCTGTGKALTYVAATNTFGCNTISGGGTGSVQLAPNSVQFPATNPALLLNTTEWSQVRFDATTSECVFWEFTIPPDYSSTPGIQIIYAMVSDNNGTHTMAWDVSLLVDDGTTDFAAQAYDTVNACDDAAIATTLGQTTTLNCSLTNIDGLAVNKAAKLRLCRDTATDTSTGDAIFYRGLFTYAR